MWAHRALSLFIAPLLSSALTVILLREQSLL